MRTTPHRTLALRWRLLAVLSACGLLVAACGNSGDDDGGTSASDSTTTTASDSSSTTAAGGQSGELDTGEFQSLSGVPGVTDDEISFAVMGTGPSNPLGYCLLECFQAGVQAYFDYRNENGGVHGRDLKIGRVADDETGNTQVTLLDLADDDSIFGIFSAPLLYSGFSDIGKTDVPMWTTFPASPDADGLKNIYVPGGTICVNCISPTTVKSAELAGATKVAALGFGVSQVSKDCATRVKDEIDKYGPALGVEFVYLNNELPFGFPNGVGPEVTAMKDAGVDFIATCIDQTSALTLEQELQRQGMDNVIVALPQGYGDDQFLSTNADVLEGDILSVAYRPVQADVPENSGMAAMIEYLKKAGQVNDYAIQGWMSADLAVTGLLAAGPDFSRTAVIDATNQITDYTAGGLLPGVDWTKAHDAPKPDEPRQTCTSFLRVRSGQLELVGDPAEPFFCWDLPMEEYTQAKTMG